MGKRMMLAAGPEDHGMRRWPGIVLWGAIALLVLLNMVGLVLDRAATIGP